MTAPPPSLPLYPLPAPHPRSLLGEKAVDVRDYSTSLSELVNICVLCNDSGLAFNEVCPT